MADLGDTLTFRTDLYDRPQDQGGVLTNADTVTLSILKPDGTLVSPAPSVLNPPTITGKYVYDHVTLVTDPPGRWIGTWTLTLSGRTGVYVETFDLGTSLITLDEAIAHLRAARVIVSGSDLDQLQFLCFVATDAVERDLGRALTRKTITETHSGGDYYIVLEHSPVISVATVVENGVTLTASDYLLDGPLLLRGNSQSITNWAWGVLNIVITLQVGYLDPPLIARKVALNAVQRLWQESQVAAHPMIDELGESMVTTAVGLLTPIELAAYNSLKVVPVA